MSTKKISTIGVLCAMALVMNLLIHFPLVPAVPFLSYDPKDVVIVIAGFIYGPLAALLMSAICSTLELFYRAGTILDLVMDMISTCSFACTAAWLYKRNHTKKGALIGLLSGVTVNILCMLIWNYIVDPIYFQMERSAVVAMLPAIGLFNLLKSGMNSGLTLFLYKPVVSILRRSSLVEKHEETEKKNASMLILGLFIIATVVCVVLSMQGII